MIDNDKNFSQTYTFTCQHGTRTVVLKEEHDDGVTWPTVLESFIDFLEATGYIGVRDKVRIQENPFTESDWSLGTYEAEQEMHW